MKQAKNLGKGRYFAEISIIIAIISIFIAITAPPVIAQTEYVLPGSAYLFVVDDTSRTGDIILSIELAADVQTMHISTSDDPLELASTELRSSITREMLSEKITTFIYQGRALILIDASAPRGYALKALEIADYLRSKDVSVITRYVDDLTSDDLREAIVQGFLVEMASPEIVNTFYGKVTTEDGAPAADVPIRIDVYGSIGGWSFTTFTNFIGDYEFSVNLLDGQQQAMIFFYVNDLLAASTTSQDSTGAQQNDFVIPSEDELPLESSWTGIGESWNEAGDDVGITGTLALSLTAADIVLAENLSNTTNFTNTISFVLRNETSDFGYGKMTIDLGSLADAGWVGHNEMLPSSALSNGTDIVGNINLGITWNEILTDYLFPSSSNITINLRSLFFDINFAASDWNITDDAFRKKFNFSFAADWQGSMSFEVVLLQFGDGETTADVLSDGQKIGAGSIRSIMTAEIPGEVAVINVFKGKVVDSYGGSLTNRVVTAIVATDTDNVSTQTVSHHFTGDYKFAVSGFAGQNVLFYVDNVFVFSAILWDTTEVIRIDLQIPASTFNFKDADSDGVPNDFDLCSDSNSSIVDSDGCDCSQKNCASLELGCVNFDWGPVCTPTCDDGFKNQGEEGIDCGGFFCMPCEEKLCEDAAEPVCIADKQPKYCDAEKNIVKNCAECGCPVEFACDETDGECYKELPRIGLNCLSKTGFEITKSGCDEFGPKYVEAGRLGDFLKVSARGNLIVRGLTKAAVQRELAGKRVCVDTEDFGCVPLDAECPGEAGILKYKTEIQTYINKLIPQKKLPLLAKLFGLKKVKVRADIGWVQPSFLRREYACEPERVTPLDICKQIISNGPSESKADILFIGHGYFSDVPLEKDARYIIDYDGKRAGADDAASSEIVNSDYFEQDVGIMTNINSSETPTWLSQGESVTKIVNGVDRTISIVAVGSSPEGYCGITVDGTLASIAVGSVQIINGVLIGVTGATVVVGNEQLTRCEISIGATEYNFRLLSERASELTEIDEGLFSVEPFKSNKEKFNMWILPDKGAIETVADPDELYGEIPKESDAWNLIDSCPGIDYVVVLSQYDEYRSFSTDKALYLGLVGMSYPGRLLLHEFGHHFGKLGDEYYNYVQGYSDLTIEVNELNCKLNHAEAEAAWGSLVTSDGPYGYFEGCGGDCGDECAQYIRPTNNSIMNDDTKLPFDPYYAVNTRGIINELEKYGPVIIPATS